MAAQKGKVTTRPIHVSTRSSFDEDHALRNGIHLPHYALIICWDLASVVAVIGVRPAVDHLRAQSSASLNRKCRRNVLAWQATGSVCTNRCLVMDCHNIEAGRRRPLGN